MYGRSRALLGSLLQGTRRKLDSREIREPAAEPYAPEVSQRILLEELEQRLLLSADLNPVAGAIDVPGETDLFVFTLDEKQTIYFDVQSSLAGLTWSLAGPSGTEVTTRPLDTTDSTACQRT